MTAYNGAEAVRAIEENIQETLVGRTCTIGLVITDCNMPVMDGFEACKSILQLLRDKGIHRTPHIVALTGHVELEYKNKALDCGIKEVFSKPIHKEILATLLME